MSKKMKFERKQARTQRKEQEPEIMAPPGEPVEETPIEASSEPIAEAAAPEPREPKPKQTTPERIAAYVQSFDWGRLRSTARKAVASGEMNDDQVDAAIDAALPPAEQAQELPLHQLMAVASLATPEKRQEYAPLLAMHAEHANNLPEKERGEMQDHLQLLGMLQQQQPQETTA